MNCFQCGLILICIIVPILSVPQMKFPTDYINFNIRLINEQHGIRTYTCWSHIYTQRTICRLSNVQDLSQYHPAFDMFVGKTFLIIAGQYTFYGPDGVTYRVRGKRPPPPGWESEDNFKPGQSVGLDTNLVKSLVG